MIDQGISIRDPAGNLQIDGKFFNYRLVQSGYATSGVYVPYTFSMGTLKAADVLVLIRPPLSVWAAGNVLANSFRAVSLRGSPDFTFAYKVFLAEPRLPLTENNGLLVRNENNEIVFDSREEWFSWDFYMRVTHGTFGGGLGTSCMGVFTEVFPTYRSVPEVGVPYLIISYAMNLLWENLGSPLFDGPAWFGRIVSDTQIDYQYRQWTMALMLFSCHFTYLMHGSALLP